MCVEVRRGLILPGASFEKTAVSVDFIGIRCIITVEVKFRQPAGKKTVIPWNFNDIFPCGKRKMAELQWLNSNMKCLEIWICDSCWNRISSLNSNMTGI